MFDATLAIADLDVAAPTPVSRLAPARLERPSLVTEVRRSRSSNPWLGLGLRQLAVLDAIVRRRSFGGAARELGYVQSAVSRQVARLERTVGQPLIERGRGRDRVSLTSAGELLAEHARAVLVQVHAARADLEAVTRLGAPSLRAGLCAGMSPWLLPPLIALLAEQRPGLRVEFLETADEDELPALVDRGALDLAIGVLPADDRGFGATPLLSDPWVLLAPADGRPARHNQVCRVLDMQAACVMLPPPSRAVELARLQLEAAGVSLHGAARVPPGPVMHAAVVARRAIALTTELSLLESAAGTAVLAPDVDLTPREIAIFWNAHRRTVGLFEWLSDAVGDVIDARTQERVALAI